MLTRRALLAGAAALAATSAHAQARFAGVTLRIGTWGGTNRDALRDLIAVPFEAAGGKVDFVVGGPQDNFAKVIAARGREPPMDSFEVLGSMVPEVAGRNLLNRLDYQNLPNAQFLELAQRQPTLVANWITQEMIIYNAEKFTELGIAPPTRLQDLANPKLAGKVCLPDITSGGGLEMVGAFAWAAGGNETNIDPGLELARSIPGVRFWKAGGEVVTQFRAGDIIAAVAHAGWAVRTRYAGVPVKTVAPDYGNGRIGLIKEGWIGVVRGTRQQAATEWYINTFLSDEVQYQMAVKTGTVPVNPTAWSRLAATPVVNELVVLDPARIARMGKLDFAKINISQWNDRWNRIIAR